VPLFDQTGSRSTRCSNEALLLCVVPPWGLREVLQYAEVLSNKDDVDAKADARSTSFASGSSTGRSAM
jgi:hypothetical protein